MTAKEYLQQVQRILSNIEQKKMELQSVRDAATHITAALGNVRVQNSSVADRVADNAVKAVDLENSIQNDMVDLFYKRYEIVSQIQQLSNALHISILYKHYVELKKLEVVADEIEKSYQYTVEVHGKALKAFEQKHKKLLS